MSCNSPVGSFAQLFRLKFGLCFSCMRLASLLGFGLLLAASLLPPGPVRMGFGYAGLFFLAWWAAHLVAHAAYAAREHRFLVRLPPRQPLSTPAALYVAKRMFAAVVQTSPLWWVMRLGSADAAWPTCNCYFLRDCWWIAGRYCNWNVQCSTIRKGTGDCPEWEGHKGNCDGVCEFLNPFSALGYAPEEIARRVGAVFDLYIATATSLDGEGRPTLHEIDPLWEGLPLEFCVKFRNWCFTAIRIVIGWDLSIGAVDNTGPVPTGREMFFAHIADAAATPALLRATKRGLVEAIQARNAALVEVPLAEFWKTFPTYVPAHMGNCYPHGHSEHTTALECQVLHLKALVNALLIAGSYIDTKSTEGQKTRS